MAAGYTIQYVELPNGAVPVREFLDLLDDRAAAKVAGFIDRLGSYGPQMPRKFSKNLGRGLFELRVEHFDRIFRVFYFLQPGMVIVLTSGFQKKGQETPQGEIARAERLRGLWLRWRNQYPASEAARRKILEGTGL